MRIHRIDVRSIPDVLRGVKLHTPGSARKGCRLKRGVGPRFGFHRGQRAGQWGGTIIQDSTASKEIGLRSLAYIERADVLEMKFEVKLTGRNIWQVSAMVVAREKSRINRSRDCPRRRLTLCLNSDPLATSQINAQLRYSTASSDSSSARYQPLDRLYPP